MKKLISFLGVVSVLLASTSEAATWIGIETGVGSSDYKSASDNIDVSWTGALMAGIDLNQNWSVLAGLHMGSGSSVPRKDIGIATKSEEELDYRALSLSLNRNFYLTDRQFLYASVGLNYNQTEVELRSVKTIDEDGIGYNLRAGWLFRFNQRFSFNIGLQRLGMSDVDVNSANIGMMYRF
ncbi:porin family protein [Vibrio rhizosphaerae]|uniref:Porin family protein n=1 Tax=Vibrio rhizosphaerae TaxID=398736 RepID=A0ABU4IS66_9VIBR|nr:porin family protein [Vibrio rhizosphaerae]MDW6091978.1 porin family protein [Vibrio rhizosphaerae]